MAEYKIVRLGSSWKGESRVYQYWSDEYLDIRISTLPGVSGIEFTVGSFGKPVEKQIEVTWGEDHMRDPMLFAAVTEEEKIAGYIELNMERWNNRLRVANLFVEEGYRRQGVGAFLMDHALFLAKEAGARAVILETQSCNMPAIRFYQAQGFAICGLDLFSYSNEDMEKHEVRIEMTRLL